ncbi:MAG TPA: hypothetical protein PK108_01245 [Pyrinomonadaceae bacterium]|nr:hypothetical protein [Pyrinomonadaceae bacterium]
MNASFSEAPTNLCVITVFSKVIEKGASTLANKPLMIAVPPTGF